MPRDLLAVAPQQPRDLLAETGPSTDVPQLPPEYHSYQSLMKSPAEIATMSKRNDVMALPFAALPGGKAVQTLAGGAAGAISAANEPDPSVEKTIIGGATGAATGLGLSALGPRVMKMGKAAMDRVFGNAPKAIPVPTSDELREGAKAAYKKAEDAGIIISKPSWQNAVADIKQTVVDEGLHPALHPKAAAVLKELESVSDNLTLEGADRLRRIVSSAGKSIEPDERRLAGIMREKLDDYLSSLSESDVLAGDPKEATTALKEARDKWSRMSKSEFVEDLVDRAGTRAGQFSGSGYENALRTEFRNVVLNPKKMRRFTAEEQESLRKVAEGGPIGNAMRWLGKFAPRGVVSSVGAQAVGNTLAGPMGGYALPILGEAGRFGATAATSRNANLASELMRRGPTAAPSAGSIDPKTLAIMNALGNAPAPGLSALTLSKLLTQPINSTP